VEVYVIFLLDMNMPRQLGKLLEARGHAWRHVADVGLQKADDSIVLEAAKQVGEVILTHDLDYGTLLAFSGDVRPSVVIFRRRNVHPKALFEAMMKSWAELAPALEAGALVILEDSALRIRRLPIGKS
jgi:predicted nuclease of predicted toxin-antitoxin system